MGAERTAAVADEWELVGVGIETVLHEAGVPSVQRHRDARPAIDAAAAEGATLVVLGSCRDLQPEAALREVRRRAPGARVVLLLGGEHHAELGTLLAQGADALLQRAAPRDDLVDGFARALAGDRVIAPALLPSLLAAREPEVAAVLPAQDPFGLTAREREVLERLAQGHTNRQIAQELFIGEETVKTHCASLYGKLSARDRRDAVAKAFAAGILG